MQISTRPKSNTLGFLKALSGGPFGFIGEFKTLSFLYNYFIKTLSPDLLLLKEDVIIHPQQGCFNIY